MALSRAYTCLFHSSEQQDLTNSFSQLVILLPDRLNFLRGDVRAGKLSLSFLQEAYLPFKHHKRILVGNTLLSRSCKLLLFSSQVSLEKAQLCPESLLFCRNTPFLPLQSRRLLRRCLCLY